MRREGPGWHALLSPLRARCPFKSSLRAHRLLAWHFVKWARRSLPPSLGPAKAVPVLPGVSRGFVPSGSEVQELPREEGGGERLSWAPLGHSGEVRILSPWRGLGVCEDRAEAWPLCFAGPASGPARGQPQPQCCRRRRAPQWLRLQQRGSLCCPLEAHRAWPPPGVPAAPGLPGLHGFLKPCLSGVHPLPLRPPRPRPGSVPSGFRSCLCLCGCAGAFLLTRRKSALA